jgi:hypothetical protein
MRMTSEEARRRVQQDREWDEVWLRCCAPGIGKDHVRMAAAHAIGARLFAWESSALKSMPQPTAEQVDRWAPMRAFAEAQAGESWALAALCLSDIPQSELESRLRSYTQAQHPGQDIEQVARERSEAFCQAVILAHQEDHA